MSFWVVTTSFILGIYLFLELLNHSVDNEFMLIKKCVKCNKHKFRWRIIRGKYGMYGEYRNKCKKCLCEEDREKQRLEQKRMEYQREDELIKNQLRSEPKSTVERFFRALDR